MRVIPSPISAPFVEEKRNCDASKKVTDEETGFTWELNPNSPKPKSSFQHLFRSPLTTHLDWPTEEEENGNYSNKCCACREWFIGPKRAIACYSCHKKGQEEWNNMSQDDKNKRLDSLSSFLNELAEKDRGNGIT